MSKDDQEILFIAKAQAMIDELRDPRLIALCGAAMFRVAGGALLAASAGEANRRRGCTKPNEAKFDQAVELVWEKMGTWIQELTDLGSTV